MSHGGNILSLETKNIRTAESNVVEIGSYCINKGDIEKAVPINTPSLISEPMWKHKTKHNTKHNKLEEIPRLCKVQLWEIWFLYKNCERGRGS